jgi:hypothetical protein
MKTVAMVVMIFLFQGISQAQNYEGPSYEQQSEWRRIAHEEGQKTMVKSTVKNYFRNKLIFLVIGGVIVAIGGMAAASNKNEE